MCNVCQCPPPSAVAFEVWQRVHVWRIHTFLHVSWLQASKAVLTPAEGDTSGPAGFPQPPAAHAPRSPRPAEQAGDGRDISPVKYQGLFRNQSKAWSLGKQAEDIDASQSNPPIPPHWTSPSFMTGVLDVPGLWNIPDWGFLSACESFISTKNGWEVASGKQSHF